MEDLRKFAENTTIHGVVDFWKMRNRCASVLWTAAFWACFSMMVYEMVNIVQQYFGSPTATQITRYYEEKVAYPRMLFCPREWINESRVTELGVSRPLLIYALSLLRNVDIAGRDRAPHSAANLSRLDEQFREFLLAKGIGNYLDFYAAIADDPDKVAVCDSCFPLKNQVLASGVCIQVKPLPAEEASVQTLPPTFRFYEVRRDAAAYDWLPDYQGPYDSDSLFVSFKPQYDFFSYDPVLLNRNSSYVVRISPMLYQRIERPDHPCRRRELALAAGYSQLMCYFDCYEKFRSICQGCRYLSYAEEPAKRLRIDQLPLCSTLTHERQPTQCADEGEFNGCAERCEPLCYEWVYETAVSNVERQRLFSNHSHADLSVMFSYQVRDGESGIEEISTYTWETFVSNVGGQMGLWMGASVMSLLHLARCLCAFVIKQLKVIGSIRLVFVAKSSTAASEPYNQKF